LGKTTRISHEPVCGSSLRAIRGAFPDAYKPKKEKTGSMIKSFVRWAFAKTRWRVVRAATINDSYMPGEAISHNSLEGWDHKFRNSDILHNYYTPSRHRLNVEILETIVRQRGVQPSETIGDVGCGLGYFLQDAAERFRHA
jgi:hypothetical protein